ncbi:MAG: hypothetical protein Roseis2KO_23540 [Roseivirga sp.]
MKKSSFLILSLAMSFGLGFSLSTANARSSMPEIVTCYFAETTGTAGYYRCGSGQSCTWYDNKDPYATTTNRECLKNPGEEELY